MKHRRIYQKVKRVDRTVEDCTTAIRRKAFQYSPRQIELQVVCLSDQKKNIQENTKRNMINTKNNVRILCHK